MIWLMNTAVSVAGLIISAVFAAFFLAGNSKTTRLMGCKKLSDFLTYAIFLSLSLGFFEVDHGQYWDVFGAVIFVVQCYSSLVSWKLFQHFRSL